MSLFEQLRREAAGKGLRFLVIGGHAVIEHGFQRGTEDVDIIVSKDDRAQWTKIVIGLGYKLLRDGGTFLQFEAADASRWDLDLMLVPPAVLVRLFATAKAATLEGAAVVVPSLEHLLALKVHAMKHAKGLRVLKDTTDVAQLLSVNRIDPKSAWLREIFEKHGDLMLYERIVRLLT